MAGALRKDDAIERFAQMRGNTQEYFRITRKGGAFLFVVIGLLPLGIGYLSYHTHGQIQLAGNRRNQPLMRSWPTPSGKLHQAEAEE